MSDASWARANAKFISYDNGGKKSTLTTTNCNSDADKISVKFFGHTITLHPYKNGGFITMTNPKGYSRLLLCSDEQLHAIHAEMKAGTFRKRHSQCKKLMDDSTSGITAKYAWCDDIPDDNTYPIYYGDA